VKAGWLVKNKGQWSLTQEGQQALSQFTDPADFTRESDRLYKVWAQGQPAAAVDEPEQTASESAAITLEEAEEGAWSEISRYLLAMNAYEFQDLVAALLRAMGYHIAWVSPPGPDQGLDILAYTDPLGANGPRIKVQVKRRADKVGVEGIRAFMALVGQQDVGIFVCTGGFTPDAEREARAQESRRLLLIGLDRLFDLWVEHYERVAEPERRLLPLKPVHFLIPRE
jgi:restriction system protein